MLLCGGSFKTEIVITSFRLQVMIINYKLCTSGPLSPGCQLLVIVHRLASPSNHFPPMYPSSIFLTINVADDQRGVHG